MTASNECTMSRRKHYYIFCLKKTLSTLAMGTERSLNWGCSHILWGKRVQKYFISIVSEYSKNIFNFSVTIACLIYRVPWPKGLMVKDLQDSICQISHLSS